MFYLWEFEFFEEGEFVNAFPVDGLEGGTCGYGLNQAVEYAHDWLATIVDDALMNGKELPEPHFGTEPKHGGKMIVIAVSRNLNDIPAMTAADAARELGLSRARISQLITAGILESWKAGTKRMVSKSSVDARKEQMGVSRRHIDVASA